MHRLLLAATLSFGLLFAAGGVSSASAWSVSDHTASGPTTVPAQILPVHYDRHRPHYAPPHHWRRPVPPWHRYGYEHRTHGYRAHHHGWR